MSSATIFDDMVSKNYAYDLGLGLLYCQIEGKCVLWIGVVTHGARITPNVLYRCSIRFLKFLLKLGKAN